MIEVSLDELVPGKNYYFIITTNKDIINVGKCAKYHGKYMSYTNNGVFISIKFKNVITAIYANKPFKFRDNDCNKIPTILNYMVDRNNIYTFILHFNYHHVLVSPFYIFYKDTVDEVKHAPKLPEALQGRAFHASILDITGDPYAAKEITSELYTIPFPGNQATDYLYKHTHGSNKQFQCSPNPPGWRRNKVFDRIPPKGTVDNCLGCLMSGGNRLCISRKKNKRKIKKTANRRKR